MQINEIQIELNKTYPTDLTKALIESYLSSLREYRKKNWNFCINELGQFIEICRRIVCINLGDAPMALSVALPNFTPSVLQCWEQKDKSIYDESVRIIIPRQLYSMYCVRSKRGAIHANHINPNQIDARVLLDQAKWVFAELFRLSSTLSFEETLLIIDSIMVKEFDVIWKVNDKYRIIDTSMKTPTKVLCLLYLKDEQLDIDLQEQIEYKNTSNFRILLRKLHAEKKIEYSNSKCYISPLGINFVEKLF